jgi:Cys-tRNA(Pro)/Cys-tRNA(Cys) deacylase
MKTNAMRELDKLGVSYNVKQHSKEVFTSGEAAAQRGVRLEQIAKTMICKTHDNRLIMSILPGNRRLSLKKVAKVVGDRKVSLMSPNELRSKLKVIVGAISPIDLAHKTDVILVDQGILEEDIIDISSGRPDAGIELRSSDLVTTLNARVSEISD